MSYGKVHDAYWDGEKIEPLSDRACLLGLFLITGPHRNAVGCFKLGVGAIMDLPRFAEWGFEGVAAALEEMVQTGFIVRDDRSGWTYICNALVKDPISSTNGAIHAAALAARVPTNTVVYQRLKDRLEPQLKGFDKALKNREGWPMRAASKGAAKDLSKPLIKDLTEPLPKGVPEDPPTPLPSPLPSPLPLQGANPTGLPAVVEEVQDDLEVATELWNATAKTYGLPTVQKLTNQRKAKLRARLKDCGGLEGWKAALAKIAANAWMHGDNDRGWKADFDFLVAESKFVKLIEGGYDRGASAANGVTSGQAPPHAETFDAAEVERFVKSRTGLLRAAGYSPAEASAIVKLNLSDDDFAAKVAEKTGVAAVSRETEAPRLALVESESPVLRGCLPDGSCHAPGDHDCAFTIPPGNRRAAE